MVEIRSRHFTDDIFKWTFLNEDIWISLNMSLKFVPRAPPINNIPSLVQIMAWRLPGDKPLSEPMMVSLLTPICVTRPQWVNDPQGITIQLLIYYNDVIMDMMASQITSLTIVYSAVYSGADQRIHQSSASLAFVRGIHRGPFDDVVMD